MSLLDDLVCSYYMRNSESENPNGESPSTVEVTSEEFQTLPKNATKVMKVTPVAPVTLSNTHINPAQWSREKCDKAIRSSLNSALSEALELDSTFQLVPWEPPLHKIAASKRRTVPRKNIAKPRDHHVQSAFSFHVQCIDCQYFHQFDNHPNFGRCEHDCKLDITGVYSTDWIQCDEFQQLVGSQDFEEFPEKQGGAIKC